jgi:hypothetical protein
MSVKETLKQDVKDAGTRVASRQITSTLKGALVGVMKSNGMRRPQVKAFSEFLETDMGESVINLMLGWGLTYAPMISNDSRVQALAEEMRVDGMSIAGNVIVDSIMENVLPTLMSNIEMLDAPKARVELPEEVDEAEKPHQLKAEARAK